MTTSSKNIIPFSPDPTAQLELEWVYRQLYLLSDVIAELTDGTGSKLKYLKIVSSVDATASAYTISEHEHVILVDADDGNMTLNIPAGTDRKRLHIKNISTAAGGGYNVIVTPNGSDQIDNAASYSLIKNEAISPIYMAADANWYIL